MTDKREHQPRRLGKSLAELVTAEDLDATIEIREGHTRPTAVAASPGPSRSNMRDTESTGLRNRASQFQRETRAHRRDGWCLP